MANATSTLFLTSDLVFIYKSETCLAEALEPERLGATCSAVAGGTRTGTCDALTRGSPESGGDWETSCSECNGETDEMTL